MNNRGSIFNYAITYILIIPIGIFLIILLTGFISNNVNEKSFYNDVKTIFKESLDAENIDTVEKMEEFMLVRFEFYKYDLDNISIDVTDMGDYIYFRATKKYNSFLQDVKYNFKKAYNDIVGKKTDETDRYIYYDVRFKGSYDDHKEVVIEDYDIDIDDKNLPKDDLIEA